jgi:hypothetical protein
MSMTIGTVTIAIAADGSLTYTGSGMARALAEQRAPPIAATIAAAYGGAIPADILHIYNTAFFGGKLADSCLADATAMVNYLQANAVAHVTSQSLGAVPSSTSHGTPIDAPASPVDVPIT